MNVVLAWRSTNLRPEEKRPLLCDRAPGDGSSPVRLPGHFSSLKEIIPDKQLERLQLELNRRFLAETAQKNSTSLWSARFWKKTSKVVERRVRRVESGLI